MDRKTMTDGQSVTGKVHVAKCQYAGVSGCRYRLVTESSEPLDFDNNDYDTMESAKLNAVAMGLDLDDEYEGVDYWFVSKDENIVEDVYIPTKS